MYPHVRAHAAYCHLCYKIIGALPGVQLGHHVLVDHVRHVRGHLARRVAVGAVVELVDVTQRVAVLVEQVT